MAEIAAALVKSLRDRTGAGMMDCKKALIETGGEIEPALDWLRKKGLSAAAKKAGRAASEGLVGLAVADRAGAVVEVNAETDFVARNASFQEFVSTVASLALENGGDFDALAASAYPGADGSVADQAAQLTATIGENIRLRRSAALSVEEGIVASYVHSAAAPNVGRIGVLVALASAGDAERLAALGKQLAMHVAAAKPEAVSIDDIDAAAVARERDVLAGQARASGKPEDIIEKMVEGRLRKYYQDVVLTEQVFVIDGQTRVSEVLENAARDIGAPVEVAGFVRFALGEGIEKPHQDFAAEVAAQAAG
ncbi:MAG: elongation factor Ts [Proteobacteria bacterium]|nr:elongation factor Ts [Pseudomonadota bacterium]